MPNFNNLDLGKWKELEVWTDSLWIIPERNKSGKHNGFYHGNFVPQIPHQLILRYSKKDEVVFDPFVGSGTTAYETESLGRNFIGIDIQPELIKQIKEIILFAGKAQHSIWICVDIGMLVLHRIE